MLIESSDRQMGNIGERDWIDKYWDLILIDIYIVEFFVTILITLDNRL